MIGLILVLIGVLILGYQGFSYVSRDTIVDVGSVSIQADRTHIVWISPLVGGAAVAVGIAVLLLSGKRVNA